MELKVPFNYQLGKVEELVTGRDGKIRAAVVKVARVDKRPTLLGRAIQHLIAIEVNPNS